MPDAAAHLDPRTPVIVGVGQTEQRTGDPTDALEPTAMLAQAARAAEADSGVAGLLASLDTLAVIHILSWPYRDPGALVAADLGIAARRTIVTDDGGNYPQTLLNQACTEIQAGTADAVLIGGAEAWRARSAARREGIERDWTVQDESVSPTEALTNPEPLIHPDEWARKVMMPIQVYPMFENALRAARGWDIEDHRDRLGRLWAGFSDVAAANPNAWIQQRFSASTIRDVTPDNRMVGFPYTKLMNANNAVDQSGCLVVCSVERARSLGIATDRWVFPWSGADAHEHWYLSQRWSLAEAPAIGLAGRAALDLAGVGVDDLGHVDVYSCFPSAVQIAAREIGLSSERPLTVTGGLSFAGGPWNNYVSHSIATMVDRLRDDAGSIGLVTANGGFLTKHAFGVYSTTPPPGGFGHVDVQDQVDRLPSRPLTEVRDGPATVESAVVMHDRGSEPESATIACLLDDGSRSWGTSTDPDVMKLIVTEETAGRGGHLDPDGTFTFT